MQRRFFLLLLTLMVPVLAGAGEPDGTNPKPAVDSYALVRTTRQFIIGGVGVAGTTSGEEAAFRQLLKEPGSPARCQQLLTEATPAGQLYGLLGLSLLDPPAFQRALPRYRDSQVVIRSVGGCIPFSTTAAQIAKQIEQGQLR